MASETKSPSRLPTIGRNPRGGEFAAYLNESISMDSADMFSRIDKDFRLRMSKYFEFKKLVCPDRVYDSLLIPIRAGGAVIQKALPQRLEEIFPNQSEKDVLDIAIDLSLLLDDTVSDFNYIRYLQNAVESRLKLVLDLDTAFLIPEVSASVKKELQTKQKNIWSYVIDSLASLEIWIEKIIDFVEQVNESNGVYDFVDDGDGDENRTPGKKNSLVKHRKYVNTKTLTTYNSRTRMYFLNKSRILFPGMIWGDEPLEKVFMKYKSTNSRSSSILSALDDKKQREKIQKKFLTTSKTQDKLVIQANLVSVEFPFSGDRTIKIRHSKAGVFRELISPIIASLRAQIKIEPNKVERLAKVENSTGFLSVEINNIKNSDIPKIESTLEALVT